MDKRGESPPVGRDEASRAAAADVHELLHSAVNVASSPGSACRQAEVGSFLHTQLCVCVEGRGAQQTVSPPLTEH